MAYKKIFERYASPKKKYKEKHKAYKRKKGKEGYQTRKYREKVNPTKEQIIEQPVRTTYSNWDKPIESKPFPKPSYWYLPELIDYSNIIAINE